MIKIKRPECPNTLALATDYKHPENKDVLIEASYGKCMYCESKITHVYFGDVEHIKPKTHYPQLEFSWENLGFVCARCNNSKLDKFDESTPYINPYEENPEDFIISLGAFIATKQGNERSELTILDIGLNRPDLIQRRDERIKSVQSAINACLRTANERIKATLLEGLKNEADNDKEYSLVIKTMLKLNGLL